MEGAVAVSPEQTSKPVKQRRKRRKKRKEKQKSEIRQTAIRGSERHWLHLSIDYSQGETRNTLLNCKNTTAL